MSQRGLSCTLMRGGTSKGAYFLARDLPGDEKTRDAVLLAVMGSPDPRQIDGLGGAKPLTSKVAVVARSGDDAAQVDYLFLQVDVERPMVDAGQNCGNILAGVGPFAIEAGLVAATDPVTEVRIRMVNTDTVVVARVQTPGGRVRYDGSARLAGVPGSAAPVMIDFLDLAGSVCGALLPSGNSVDVIEGIPVSLVDNGMPVVVVRAADLGVTGHEAPTVLEADAALCARVEALRLAAGRAMGLGDVSARTVPKVSLIAPPRTDAAVATRSFIPRRVHEAIGVLGAISVGTVCVLPGTVADGVARIDREAAEISMGVEHPSGVFAVHLALSGSGAARTVTRAGIISTARLLLTGTAFVPGAVWPAA